jgi:TonB family protein
VLLIEDRRAGSPRAFTVSVIFHTVAIALLLTIRFAPALIQSKPWRVTLIAPPRELPAPLKIHVMTPRVFHPIAPAPRPTEPKLALEAPPPIEVHRAPAPLIELPHILPPPVLKTDNLAEPRIAPALAQPKLPLRAAGFAATETSAPAPERSRAAATGAFDSTESAAAVRTRAASHSSGFSDAATAPADSVKRSLANASFGDTTVAARVNASRESATAALSAPIEIQFKPRPVYSDEARRLHIEGEVQIEMVFEASGSIEIVRVVRGLGHGLDEAALAAARAIRFRPAQRDGRPVDSTAIVHIAFELAY